MLCIVCGSKTEFKDSYYFCSDCEFIFKTRELVLDETAEKKRYMQHNNSIEDERYLDYFKKFLDEIVPHINGTIGLDYGSGCANALEYVANRDYGLAMDSYDKYFSSKETLQPKYDFITCTEVIEHIENPIEFIKEIDAYLSVGGTIAFMTNLHNNNTTDFFNWWYISDPTHISFYTLKTFEYLASKLGYEVTYAVKNIIVIKKVKEYL